MSFLAKLKVDGEEYNVLHCTYGFDQPMDPVTGKPTGRPTGGRITITLESQGKFGLLHWMASPDQAKDGSILFFKNDAMARLQEVIFKKGHCVKLTENFDANSTTPMQKRIVISAETVQIGDMNFENSWGGQD